MERYYLMAFYQEPRSKQMGFAQLTRRVAIAYVICHCIWRITTLGEIVVGRLYDDKAVFIHIK